MYNKLPICPEKAEWTVGIHVWQLFLITNVHMEKRFFFLGFVSLINVSHVQRSVKIGGKTKNILFRAIHGKVQERRCVDWHGGKYRSDNISNDWNICFIGAENIISIFRIRNYRCISDIHVKILENVSTITEI